MGRGLRRGQIIRRRESLVLYKSFNTPWPHTFPSPSFNTCTGSRPLYQKEIAMLFFPVSIKYVFAPGFGSIFIGQSRFLFLHFLVLLLLVSIFKRSLGFWFLFLLVNQVLVSLSIGLLGFSFYNNWSTGFWFWSMQQVLVFIVISSLQVLALIFICPFRIFFLCWLVHKVLSIIYLVHQASGFYYRSSGLWFLYLYWYTRFGILYLLINHGRSGFYIYLLVHYVLN